MGFDSTVCLGWFDSMGFGPRCKGSCDDDDDHDDDDDDDHDDDHDEDEDEDEDGDEDVRNPLCCSPGQSNFAVSLPYLCAHT